MFAIKFSDYFKKQYQKLVKNNSILEKRIDTALVKLDDTPELVSHKVDQYWSCRVTGDIRIIWKYKAGQLVLILLKIGGQSGSNKVYK